MQPPEPTSAAILFDLDGTLVDSEPVWDVATRELASTRGTDIAHDLLLSISGLDATLAMEFLHRELAWDGHDVAADVGFVQDRVRSSYLRRVNWSGPKCCVQPVKYRVVARKLTALGCNLID